jgi:arabinan endo-1,5-alpha-L-arabinosidase
MKKGMILLSLLLFVVTGCDWSSSSSTTSSSTSSTSSSGSIHPDNWNLTGALGVHDPAIIKAGNDYYIFGTGIGIQVKRSNDGLAWRDNGKVFNFYPSWANSYVPNHESNIWAPDISFYNGTYYLYYSISSFGSNTSAIGLATTTNLASGWTDQGMVINSNGANNYNCIDPNMVVDQAGRAWLAFGSFWSGIKLIELDKSTMKPISGATIHSLATRGDTAIEAPFIVYRNGYYYLFASIGYCCRGANSTYKIIFGRSSDIIGPYVDKSGVEMLNGGGNLFDSGNDRWRGPGGQSLLGTDAIAHHAYDAYNNGAATLMIKNVYWDAEGWPYRGSGTSSSTSTSSTSGCR